ETTGVAPTEAVVVEKAASVEKTVREIPSALVRPWQVAVGSAFALGLFAAAALYWRTAFTAPPAPTPAPPPPTTHRVWPPDPVPLPSPSHIEPNAARHVAKGRDYINRMWCPDGLKEYERAIEIDPVVRSDPRTTEESLKCLDSIHGRPAAIR